MSERDANPSWTVGVVSKAIVINSFGYICTHLLQYSIYINSHAAYRYHAPYLLSACNTDTFKSRLVEKFWQQHQKIT